MISLASCYDPLFLDKEKFIILITGGRGSGKSFSCGTFIERLTFEGVPTEAAKLLAHQILYARYTMVSANISVIPEFLEKMEMDGTEKYFKSTKTDVINTLTGSRIMFRGIKTSSGNQTAKLKSIHGLTTFVCDEAEEWTSEQEFETIMYSIRQKGIQNRIIIIMNPTDSNHFIYQKYIRDTHKLVEYDGVPVQISTHPNVLHIHTTYLDNLQHLGENFLRDAQYMKANDPEKYAHVFMGQWSDMAEGAVFKNWGMVDKFPKEATKVALGMDLGYTCFKGDTLICTLNGQVHIKDIKAGDYVLTRYGYRRVVRLIYNGRKRVVRKSISAGHRNIEISATESHNFNVNNKWKQYKDLANGDRLYILQYTTGRYTTDTQTGNTRITFTTSINTKGCSTKKYYTKKYGSPITEKYPTGVSSIMLTSTRSTTTSATYNVYQEANTQKYTGLLRNITRSIQTLKEKIVTAKRIGKQGAMSLWNGLRLNQDIARRAESLLYPRTHTSDTVHINVIGGINCQRQSSIPCGCANGAGKNTGTTNTFRHTPVPLTVAINSQPITDVKTISEEICDVYDLEVEGVHEYFANGVLVHNCDPTAIVKCGLVGNDLYLQELCYKTQMLSRDIIQELRKFCDDNDHGRLFVYSESADPRLIKEISLGGIVIYPVQKGPGSILAGIDRIKSFDHVFMVKGSYNLEYEYHNYTWEKDKDGNYINQPIDAYNHCFVGDTPVLTDTGERRIDEILVGDRVLTSVGYRRVTKTYNNGVRETITLRLHFANGYTTELTATPEHKFITKKDEWKQFQQLAVGDVLYLRSGLMESCISDKTERNISGINFQKDGRGTASTESRSLQVSKKENLSASGVEKPIIQNQSDNIVSVATLARPEQDIIVEQIMRQERALCVEQHSVSINTARLSVAAGVALRKIDIIRKEKRQVFDIEVEGMHEFFANGVLTLNCLDAIRYFVYGKILGKVIKTVDRSKAAGRLF